VGIIYKIYLCIILVVILSVGLALLYSDYELDNMNNEHGDCLDVVISTRGTEDWCRVDLRNNPVCMDAFETATTPQDFDDELECRGFVKQQTNCQGNSQILAAMGIKCP